MAYFAFRQPNHSFAVFSSIVDGVTVYDATLEELLAEYSERMDPDDARRMVYSALSDIPLRSGSQRLHDGLDRYRECLETLACVHGPAAAARWRERLGG